MSTHKKKPARARRSLGRIAAATLGSFAFLPAIIGATPAAAGTAVDWAGIGWNDAVAGPQHFDDVFGPGAGMTVSYSTNMWDGVPNIYGGSAPVGAYAASLRMTNDRVSPDTPTSMTIEFDQPTLLSELRVGSLSELGSMWEWIEVAGYGEAGLLDHTAASVATGTYDTAGAYSAPGNGPLTFVSSGNVTARGTSRQGAGAPGYESVPAGYDNLTVGFGATPVVRVELRHFATAGPDISDPRSVAFASIVVDILDAEPAPVVVAGDYDLALANVISDSAADAITYAVTVCNQGDVASGGFTVTDQLAPGTSFTSASNGGSAAGDIVTWTIPASDELAAGECMTLTVAVAVDSATADTCINTAEISSDSGDDIDSTPDTVLTGAGSDALVDILDATGLATAGAVSGDEDDHDIALCTPGAITTPITTPPTTPISPVPVAPNSPAILPITGTDTGGVAGLALVLLTLGGSLVFVSSQARYAMARVDD